MPQDNAATIYKHMRDAWATLTAPGAPFEIVPIEVRGVALKSYLNAPASMRDVWCGSAEHGAQDYLVFQDQRWSYADAHAQVAAIANWLVERGVAPGDRVALAMRNYPEWLLCYWATLSIGAASVGMNAWWVGAEMVYGLQDATPKVLIADSERLQRLQPLRSDIPSTSVVAVRCDPELYPGAVPFSELLNSPGALPDIPVDPDADACIFYTSGTTGRPKGAQLTHRGCVSNLMNLGFAGALATMVAELRGLPVPDPAQLPQPAALITTPLFHVTANNCVAHPLTANGGKMVHMYRWDAEQALQQIEKERITVMTGVPVMAREIISHPDFGKYDTSTLQTLGGGGAQLQPDLVGKIDETVPNARPNTGYGMTETCGIITSISGDFFVDKPDSAGPAMPNFETKVVNADGEALPQGELGELWVRGSCVIKGYLNRPEATAESITDGWLHTGDIARLDEDGFIFIVDRLKDMVLRGGENVYCAEVEAALFSHDDVMECSVFGVPDDRLGEEVAAAVVCKAGSSINADALRAHCADKIAKHKVPRFIWLLNEPLPRNASGKFLKRELRESLRIENAA